MATTRHTTSRSGRVWLQNAADRIAELTYRLKLRCSRRRLLLYLVFAVACGSMCWVTDNFFMSLPQHVGMFPSNEYKAIGFVAISLLTLAVMSVPLLIVRYHRIRVGIVAEWLCKSLDHRLNELGCRVTASPGMDIEATYVELIHLFTNEKGTVYLFTPNAIYFFADRMKIASLSGNPEIAMKLDVMRKNAPKLRKRIEDYGGDIVAILPDPYSAKTIAFHEHRAEILGLEIDVLVRANREALDWLKGILSKRKEQSHSTHIRLSPHGIQYRCVMATSRCLVQKLPDAGFGIAEGVYEIERQDPSFSGIRDVLATMKNLLDDELSYAA